MIPPEPLVREQAYYQWERRGGGHGEEVQDWVAAEEHLTFFINYQPISLYYLNCKPKVFIGERRKTCRFCGRGRRKTSFRKVAHSLPEFFGNKSIISKDECDECNEYFGKSLEDHLAKMTMPIRTALGISGKSGVPSYKSKAGKSRLDRNNQTRRIIIEESFDDRFTSVNHDEKVMWIDIPAQPFLPIAVLKCFTKIALSVIPENELKHFAGTIRWIRDPDHSRSEGRFNGAGCYVYMTTAPFHAPWVMVLKRADQFARLNYIALLLGTGQILFQASIPFCAMDAHLNGCTLELPRLASHLLQGCVLSACYTVPLDSSWPNHEFKFSVMMTYEQTVVLSPGLDGRPPFSRLDISQGLASHEANQL